MPASHRSWVEFIDGPLDGRREQTQTSPSLFPRQLPVFLSAGAPDTETAGVQQESISSVAIYRRHRHGKSWVYRYVQSKSPADYHDTYGD